MRTLSTTLLKAINEGSAFKFAVKMVAREKRIWYDIYSENHLPLKFKASSGDAYYSTFQTYQPVPQSYIEFETGKYLGTFPKVTGSTSAYIGFFSNLDVTESYNLLTYELSTVTGPWSKNKIFLNARTNKFHIGFMNHSGSNRYISVYDISQIYTGGHLAVTLGTDYYNLTLPGTIENASINPFFHQMTESLAYEGVQYMVVDQGGIRCGFYEKNTPINVTSPYRIMFPNGVALDKHLINSAMVSSIFENNTCYYYITDPFSGCVYGMSYNIATRSWSDVFVAIPSDLSFFMINNAIYTNGKYLLSGQFGRQGATFVEFDRNSLVPVYNQLLSSIDGKIFSYERAVLVSTIGDNAITFLSMDNSKVIYASLNRYASDANIPAYGYTANSLEISQNEILAFTLSESSGDANMQVAIANGHDQYSNEPYLNKGNVVEVYFGMMNENDEWEWVLWSTYIIAEKERSSSNKNLTLVLNQWGIYNLATLTSPFYFEIQSKQIKYDSLYALDNMYVAPNGGIRRNSYFVDLWNNQAYSDTGITGLQSVDGGGAGIFTITNTTTVYGVRTSEIMDQFGGFMNPALTDNLQLKIYGWSYTSVGTLANPTIGCKIRVKKLTGEVVTLTGTVSGNAYFPQYYPDAESGACPIIFNFTMSGNYSAGDQILYVILTLTNPSATGVSNTYFERVEFTSGSTITVPFKTNTPWTLDEVNGGITVPAPGRYFMMFSQTPYTTLNFDIQATFQSVKDTSDTHGTLEFGLVGLADDEDNCVMAVYDRYLQLLKIIKIRDSVETILHQVSVSAMDADTVTMMFSHKNGYFSARYLKSGNEWSDVQASYTWQATDGYLIKPVALAHVGIVGKKNPPHFYGNTFSNCSTYNLACIDDADNMFQYFPSSNGKIDLNTITYDYASKTAEADLDRIYGPVQPRTQKQYAASKYYAWSSWGLECRIHRWDKGGTDKKTNATWWDQALISCDSGYAWAIWKTQWRYKLTATTYEYGRTLFYSQEMNGMVIGLANKVFVSNGLKTISIADDEILMHGYMDPVYLHKTDIIKCVSFFAATDDENATIKDMIAKICKISGVNPSFSGDLTYSELALAAGVGFPLA
jgi:hypothetical protein